MRQCRVSAQITVRKDYGVVWTYQGQTPYNLRRCLGAERTHDREATGERWGEKEETSLLYTQLKKNGTRWGQGGEMGKMHHEGLVITTSRPRVSRRRPAPAPAVEPDPWRGCGLPVNLPVDVQIPAIRQTRPVSHG
jgi:hypothetical protein